MGPFFQNGENLKILKNGPIYREKSLKMGLDLRFEWHISVQSKSEYLPGDKIRKFVKIPYTSASSTSHLSTKRHNKISDILSSKMSHKSPV